MRKLALGLSLVLVLGSSSFAAAATVHVEANRQTLTDLGVFSSGTYKITASGIIDLAGGAGSGLFDVDPTGKPVTPVQYTEYSYFNPAGADYDMNPGNYGPAGAGFNLGSLVGSLTANPSAGDFFKIGFGTIVDLASTSHIYAFVNDTYYSNNDGCFEVNVAAVPELSTWAMMLVGFAGLGFAGFKQTKRRAIAA